MDFFLGGEFMCIKTLYYEADFVLRSLVTTKLNGQGFIVDTVVEPNPSFMEYDLERYDLLLFSLDKLESAYFKLVEDIRKKHPNVGVVLMFSSVTKNQQLTFYEVGADKIIIKPLDIELVLAELGAFKRRLETLNYKRKVGDVAFNVAQQYVERENELARLNPTEAKLLLRLIDRIGEGTVTNREIMDLLNQTTGYDSSKGTKVYIYRIRKKLERIKCEKIHIRNDYGQGYYLEIDN